MQHEQLILDALACEIETFPERLIPVNADLIARLQPLVDGVEFDLEQLLPFELDDADVSYASRSSPHSSAASSRRLRCSQSGIT